MTGITISHNREEAIAILSSTPTIMSLSTRTSNMCKEERILNTINTIKNRDHNQKTSIIHQQKETNTTTERGVELLHRLKPSMIVIRGK
jgi:hypothetical protein